MAAIDKALTTLARAKSYLDISTTGKDTVLTMLIIGASKYFERQTKRTYNREAVTNELYDGNGSEQITLKKYPVISGQTVQLQKRATSAVNNSDYETIDSDRYFINYNSGIITIPKDKWLGIGGFIKGVNNYRISYTAGFYLPSDNQFEDGTDDNLDLPQDIELAVLELVSHEYNRRLTKGVDSERVRDVSIQYSKAAQKNELVKDAIETYKAYF